LFTMLPSTGSTPNPIRSPVVLGPPGRLKCTVFDRDRRKRSR
jgi:hypothetical protein